MAQKGVEINLKKTKKSVSELKGVRITFASSDHDLSIKAKKADEFLKEGHKVKIEMRLKGREKAHSDIAQQRFLQFLEKLETPHKKEQELKRMGATFTMIVVKN